MVTLAYAEWIMLPEETRGSFWEFAEAKLAENNIEGYAVSENGEVEKQFIKGLKIGDYINYDVSIGSDTDGGEYTMTTIQTNYVTPQIYDVTNYDGTWQVLYNDTIRGLQIISSDNVLKNDINSLIYFKGSVDVYNSLVTNLNIMAGYYANALYATSARCVRI